ncbi:hypothetical protein [Paenibacillus sp. Leaf72]|uniref:hypothetical protein n=1 Tax=Paenibacillus sp. Leaf72 TaxID=1736234 RepID=UPI000B1461BF|nr:hypothetical protein [Paenibacillus sp. Leaf72]
MIDLETYGYTKIEEIPGGRVMLPSSMRTSLSKTKRAIDKRAQNKSIAMWSKQTKKTGA